MQQNSVSSIRSMPPMKLAALPVREHEQAGDKLVKVQHGVVDLLRRRGGACIPALQPAD